MWPVIVRSHLIRPIIRRSARNRIDCYREYPSGTTAFKLPNGGYGRNKFPE